MKKQMTTMKTYSITYNKIVTVIETETTVVNGQLTEGTNASVYSFNTKKDFFNWASDKEAMKVTVSQNLKGFTNKMKSLGFDLEIDEDWSNDYSTQLYVSK